MSASGPISPADRLVITRAEVAGLLEYLGRCPCREVLELVLLLRELEPVRETKRTRRRPVPSDGVEPPRTGELTDGEAIDSADSRALQ